jgi:hypothetical protein
MTTLSFPLADLTSMFFNSKKDKLYKALENAEKNKIISALNAYAMEADAIEDYMNIFNSWSASEDVQLEVGRFILKLLAQDASYSIFRVEKDYWIESSWEYRSPWLEKLFKNFLTPELRSDIENFLEEHFPIKKEGFLKKMKTS